MTTLVVGVDVAQATLVPALWQAGQGTVLATVPNTAEGFAQLATAVQTQQQRSGATTIHVVLEPTGGYELALAIFAAQQGWVVSLPNPRQVRDWAKGLGRRAKTDRQDALLLARYGAERQPPAWVPLPAEIQELESLLRRREDLEQMLRQERNRRGQLAQRPGVAKAVPPSIDRLIEALEQEVAQVEEALAALQRQYPQIRADLTRIRQVPGIGPKNGPWVLVVLHRWHALTGGQGDGKGLTAYLGLDPQPHESGTSVRGPTPISRMGLGHLRRQLFLGALGGVRGKNPLRAFYRRLVDRGKPKMVALIAAARKILVWAWAVFKHQTTFDPTKVTRDVPATP